MTYTTFKEATDELNRQRLLFENKFCPAANSRNMCEHCHSYFFGKVLKPGESKFIIHLPQCTSPLVTGTIEHLME
jgi:hypothetical protein